MVSFNCQQSRSKINGISNKQISVENRVRVRGISVCVQSICTGQLFVHFYTIKASNTILTLFSTSDQNNTIFILIKIQLTNKKMFFFHSFTNTSRLRPFIPLFATKCRDSHPFCFMYKIHTHAFASTLFLLRVSISFFSFRHVYTATHTSSLYHRVVPQ